MHHVVVPDQHTHLAAEVVAVEVPTNVAGSRSLRALPWVVAWCLMARQQGSRLAALDGLGGRLRFLHACGADRKN